MSESKQGAQRSLQLVGGHEWQVGAPTEAPHASLVLGSPVNGRLSYAFGDGWWGEVVEWLDQNDIMGRLNW